MKTINVLIICLTVIIIIGGTSYFTWIGNLSETPYKQCLDFCRGGYSSVRQLCLETCHNDFKEILFELSDKFFPIVEQLMNDAICVNGVTND